MTHITRSTPFSRVIPMLMFPAMVVFTTQSTAEVSSMSSSELTETYIKDSTIIVTPKKKKDCNTQDQSAAGNTNDCSDDRKQTEQKTYSSLTIAPIENTDLDISEIQNSQNHEDSVQTATLLNEEILRNAAVESVFAPELVVSIPSYQELITPPVAELIDDPRYIVPEGDFAFQYEGGTNSNDLGISRTADKFTFSIGNLPGIEKIELPNAINEGPLLIEPRETGGFDLTINIPER